LPPNSDALAGRFETIAKCGEPTSHRAGKPCGWHVSGCALEIDHEFTLPLGSKIASHSLGRASRGPVGPQWHLLGPCRQIFTSGFTGNRRTAVDCTRIPRHSVHGSF